MERSIFEVDWPFPSLLVAIGFGENQGEFNFSLPYADWMLKCGVWVGD